MVMSVDAKSVGCRGSLVPSLYNNPTIFLSELQSPCRPVNTVKLCGQPIETILKDNL